MSNLKFGDLRHDGFRFRGYGKRKDGGRFERWLSPIAFDKQVAASREKSRTAQRDKYLADPKAYNARTRNNLAIAKARDPITYASKMLWRSAQSRAKIKGVPFSLSLDWVSERVAAGVCEVTGLALHIETKIKTKNCGLKSPFAPSIDRRDPSAGYTEENCQVTCWGFNLAKSNFSLEDTLTIARALVKNHPETKRK